jgi:hypothetical protein
MVLTGDNTALPLTSPRIVSNVWRHYLDIMTAREYYWILVGGGQCVAICPTVHSTRNNLAQSVSNVEVEKP